MRRLLTRTISVCHRGRRRLALCLIVALAAAGCRSEHKIDFGGNTRPSSVRLIQPRSRNIVRIVGQPSFIESYERTSIYPKPTAYIQKWNVDIGDKVAKSDVLATLFAAGASRTVRDEKGGRRTRSGAGRAGQGGR